MDITQFVVKNLITYYKQEFTSVWTLSDQSCKDKLLVILKELDKDFILRNNVISNYLSSNNLFTTFVGAYLSICFGNNASAGINTFENILRLYKKSSPSSLEGRLYFYVSTLIDQLNSQGFITAFDGQTSHFTVPLDDILRLKNQTTSTH